MFSTNGQQAVPLPQLYECPTCSVLSVKLDKDIRITENNLLATAAAAIVRRITTLRILRVLSVDAGSLKSIDLTVDMACYLMGEEAHEEPMVGEGRPMHTPGPDQPIDTPYKTRSRSIEAVNSVRSNDDAVVVDVDR